MRIACNCTCPLSVGVVTATLLWCLPEQYANNNVHDVGHAITAQRLRSTYLTQHGDLKLVRHAFRAFVIESACARERAMLQRVVALPCCTKMVVDR